MDGEPSHGLTLPQRAYTALVGLVLHVCSRDGGGRYEQTLETQYEHYTKTHRPDGEILFLAADPNCGIRGIGTALLSEFEATTHGKRIYLNTDDACTYQFYEHRGYIREEEDRITLRMRKGDVPLTCYIYDKVL